MLYLGMLIKVGGEERVKGERPTWLGIACLRLGVGRNGKNQQ